ncbi:MAG: beta-galactosidase [Planctomycetota bacterium]
MNSNVPRHQQPTSLNAFLFGAPYYPEHWTATDREPDPARMASAGVNVVRMGEFAWDVMEPREGELDFSLFDQTIDRLAEHGIRTILCTPTATPPRWLTENHEDWFRIDADGRRMQHGSRQHCCTNNKGFRLASRQITQALAEHFAGNDNVIGWQTDNELYCHMSECYCPACVAGFRAWLQAKYRTIDALNEAWGTRFWALTFDDFAQVPLPRDDRPAFPNPTHQLDYYRYLADSIRKFQAEQVQALRSTGRDWWIMHNGLFEHIDYFRFTEDLDFLGVDVYPRFAGEMPERAVWAAMLNERCRAASGGYIVPEQQGGAGGQKPYLHRVVAPGQMRLWAYQSIAHGADGILHFRWRTCRFGAEEYWNGILDHDNVPRRRYDEFSREGAEFRRLGERILGTTLDVQAAVLVAHDQAEAHATMSHGLPGPRQQAEAAYRQLWERHLPCGLVDARDRLDGLKLAIVPSMPLIDEALIERLRRFVHGGGTLLVTARSAIRDRNNRVLASTPPGPLADLVGATVEEFGAVPPESLHMTLDTSRVPCGPACEILSPRGGQCVATWSAPAEAGPSAAADQPAVITRKVGKGQAIYVGTYLTDANAAALMDFALAEPDVQPLAHADPYVEVTCRRDTKRRLILAMNHYGRSKKLRHVPAGIELITGQPCEGAWELEPYGVAIIDCRS